MKGFLNKVQRRVSGSGPDGAAEAAVLAGKTNGDGKSPETAAKSPNSPNTGSKSGAALPGPDVVPKADVTLPRRERRYLLL